MLSLTDVGKLTKDLNAVYQPGGSGTCSGAADKKHMLLLVQKLDVYTEEVAAAAEKEGLTEDENVAQWGKDMGDWIARLTAMKNVLDDPSIPMTGTESCKAIYDDVVGPLLDGDHRKAEETAGIVNPAVVKYPDLATPYILGNGVLEYRKFQKERFKALIGYLLEEAKNLGKRLKRAAGIKTGHIIAGVVVVGGFLYLSNRSGR
jgi:hypothetical protein